MTQTTASAITPSSAGPAVTSGADTGQARFLTGEAVHVDLRIARIGSRALAKSIDIIVQVMLFVALQVLLLLIVGAMVAGATGLFVDDAMLTAGEIVMTVLALIGYPVLLETLTRGRTFGKLVVGLRVVRDDGGPITFRHAVTRGMIGAALEWPGLVGAPLTWLATIAIMIASRQGKRIGDHAAGTVVIHERTPAAWGWVPQMPAGLGHWAATLDLAGLDDDLALAVRHFLARNRQIREPARSELGQRLAREVAAVTNPPPPPGAAGWAYLAAVHAERHRRAASQLSAARSRAAAIWIDGGTIAPKPTTNTNPAPAIRPAAASQSGQAMPVVRSPRPPMP